jgi:hypothetical protein
MRANIRTDMPHTAGPRTIATSVGSQKRDHAAFAQSRHDWVDAPCVIGSEAKQSSILRDWIASSLALLAKTGSHLNPTSSGYQNSSSTRP